MKRKGNLFDKICSIENLILADKRASKSKAKQIGVIEHNKNKQENILKLHEILMNRTYKTSKYFIFKIYDIKERIIYRLPYYPDRIVHHAIMIVLESIFVNSFVADTYNCIKKRGIHKASYNLREALKDVNNTSYCLKLDIKKFYPNIDHNILKQLIRRKIKDNYLLNLLDEIIDSTDGCPIGNYLSQYFANYYLSGFDHWLKQTKNIKYYFRYCDDLVILNSNKIILHQLRIDIEIYLRNNLNLTVKSNYQVFKVNSRSIDFVGYKHYHNYTLLRKRIKTNFIKTIKSNPKQESLNSYNGWIKHCNGINLKTKYL